MNRRNAAVLPGVEEDWNMEIKPCKSGRKSLLLIVGAFILLIMIAMTPATAGLVLPADGQQETVHAKVLQLPLSFTENQGQAPDGIAFHIRAAGHTIAFTPGGVILRTTQEMDDRTESSEVRMSFVGAAESPAITGIDPLPGKANFFIGNDASQWETDVPMFSAIRYEQVYPGIDLVYRGTEGVLKREFVVAPGVNPDQIVLSYSGIDSLRLAEDGSLKIATPLGVITDEAPVAYQLAGEQMVPVTVSYDIIGDTLVGFTTGTYDPTKSLTIDPSLKYSTYLGGTGGDFGYGIATDSSGNMYITGYTTSTDFPLADPLQATKSGAADIFITKLNPAGTEVLYSTYLGGEGDDYAWSIVVDGDENIYIAGRTRSDDFPVSNPTQSTNNGGNNGDTILAKLNPSGSALLFSTYLGGNADDMPGQYGNCLAIDASGNMYVTGQTGSPDFPVVNPIQASLNGTRDIFLTKIDPSTPAVVYSTYLGGSGNDGGNDVAVDETGAAYIAGQTNSADFPLVDALQSTLGGSYDALFLKVNPSGSALEYASYLGGAGSDNVYAAAVGTDHSMYIAGSTSSANFPVVNPVQDTNGGTGSDAFVVKIDPAGSALDYATYLGGAGNSESARAIAVDSSGSAYIAGVTNGAGFPTVNPIQGYVALRDSFITKLNSAGDEIVYSTYIGGDNNDDIYSLAIDGNGNAYVTGMTQSSNFPTVSPLQATSGGTWEAFVAILEDDRAPTADFTANQTTGPAPLTVRFTDESTGSPTSWVWDFGDDSTSADQNPEHQYTAPGTYSVSLTATNALGSDSASKAGYIIATDGGGPLSGNNQIYVRVGNDLGAKYNIFGNNTYHVNFVGSGTGLNDLHISTDPEAPAGQVTFTTAPSGTFYVTNTGTRTYKDDIILMLAVNGTIPDDFSVQVRSSGYTWTPLPDAAPDIGAVGYVSGAVDETFTREDFIYGPQAWKPAGDPNYPLFDGENIDDPANMHRILFIDTRVGTLGTGFESLTDRGAAKIEFTFTNLGAHAAFNAYAYCYQTKNGDTMVAWTNRLSSTGANGFSVGIPRAPVADFTANVTEGPVPLTVRFTDTSLYLPTGWLWNFGDDATSGDRNPEHTYTSPGTYTVKLTATNALGSNSRQVSGYITVSEGPSQPVADFTANVTEGPVPLTVAFTDTTSGVPTEWNWEFGDGATSTLKNPVHTYEEMGTYSVNLTVGNTFGVDFENKTAFITANAPLPKTWTVGATGCDFTDLDSAFGNALMNDGDTISIAPGSYTFATGLTKSVTVHGAGADLVTATMNAGSNLYFSGAGTVVEGITFTANTKILYVSGGNSLVRNCVFDAIPTSANIYIQSANTGVENCTFQNCAVQNILVLAGDGDVVRNCTFQANTNRNIQVSGSDCLIENNIFRDNVQGSSVKGIIRMQSTKNLTVTRNEFLDNTAPGGVISLKTVSTGNSIYLNNFVGNSVDVVIDTGTSQPITWVSPESILYTYRGSTFTGNLGNFWSAYSGTDTDDNGIGDASLTLGTSQTDTAPLMDRWQYFFGAVHPLAAVTVHPETATVNVSQTLTFSATAYDDTGAEMTGVSFNWSSSNTTVGTIDETGLFAAKAAGTTLINATNNGIRGSSQVLVDDQPPIADFTADVTAGPVPLTVRFTDTSVNSPTGWFWEFGDGTNSTSRNSTHVYNGTGNFTVSLTVSNTAGSNSMQVTDYISVNRQPVADFTANKTRGKFPLTVCFTDTSSNSPAAWSWDFGDGATSTDQHPTHMYETVGNYTVSLQASNSDGSNSTTKSDFISVRETNADPLPAPRYIFIDVANDAGAKFNLDGPEFGGPDNTYYIKANGGGLGAIHITNDPNVISGQVTTTNASSGVLYITNSGGRGYDDEIVLLVSVRDPIPDDFAVRIRASGYQWDPVEAAGHKPTAYTYADGAVDETFTKDDFIYGPQTWKPGPGSAVVPSHPLYYGQDIQNQSTAAYLMFVDMNVGNLKQSAFAEPLQDKGAVKVEYWFENMPTHAAFNGYGWCLISNQDQGISWTNDITGIGASGYSVTDIPLSTTPIADFTADVTSGTVPLTVAFTDTSGGVSPTSWAWDFGDGATATVQNPTHTYTAIGRYNVTLTVTNDAGSDTLTRPHYISVRDAPSAPPEREENFTLRDNGTTVSDVGGRQQVSFNATAGNGTVSGNDIILSTGSLNVTILTDGLTTAGNVSTGNVTGVRLESSQPAAAALGGNVGNVSVGFNASVNAYNPNLGITTSIYDQPSDTASTAFALAAANDGLTITSTAYAVYFTKTNLGANDTISNAMLRMTVSPAWVNANGGPGAIRIFRQSDDGVTSALATTYLGLDGDGMMVFEAVSPNGFSAFAFVATKAVSTPPQSTSSSGSSGGSSVKPTVSTGSAKLLTASWGGVLRPYLVNADEGYAHLCLDTGVTALNGNGEPLPEVGITAVSTLPSAPPYAFSGYAVNCSPDGATFSPAIDLVFTFTAGEWAGLLGTVDGDVTRLVVQGYNPTTGVWEDCPTSVDAAGRTVTAQVSHFSTYVLTCAPTATTTPEQTTTAPESPDSGVQEPGSAQPSGEPPQLIFLWAGIVVLICAVIGALYFVRKNR